ncbi:MAG: hypothetical protein ABIW50_02060 [Candidatus Limnocylindria bacterium]
MPELADRPSRLQTRAIGLAVLVIAAAIAATVMFSILRASPALAIEGQPAAGETLELNGSGFEPGDILLLTWNGREAAWMPPVRVNDDGSFVIEVVLPRGLSDGQYVIGTTDGSDDGLATVMVAVGTEPTWQPGVAREPFDTTPVTSPRPSASEAPELSVPMTIPTAEASVAPDPTQIPAAVADAGGSGTGGSTAAPPPSAPPMPVMPGVGDHGNPLHCMGYPEPRVWLESQDWWDPIPVLGGLGHLHMGMCFPLGQTVSGVANFDIRVVLHRNAGTLIRIKMQDDNSKEHLVLRPNKAIGDGAYWYKVAIDTRNMPDGLRLFRFYADLEHPNGNTQTARPIFSLRVDNGGAAQDWSDRSREVRTTAWYREANPELDWGYLGAVVQDFDPGPHSAAFSVGAKCSVNGDNGGASNSSPPLARWSAHVDPDFHAGNDGLVLGQGSGQLSGDISVPAGSLSPGWHRLVLRCTQVLGDRTHSAVGIYSFLVDR